MKLEQSIMDLKGIGEKNAALFHKLNIETIEDLLYHFPKEYESYPNPESLSQFLARGNSKGALFLVIKSNPVLKHVRGLSILRFSAIDEEGGIVNVTFFNMPYLKNSIKVGSNYIFYGTVTMKDGSAFMSHPKMFKVQEYKEMAGAVMPVYALTKGLSNHSVMKFCREAFEQLEDIPDYLTEAIKLKYNFLSVKDSLYQIHVPQNYEYIRKARERFAYEEFLLFLLSIKSNQTAERKMNYELIETADAGRLIEQLPYELTHSQSEAFLKIKQDMLSGNCMNRLLQGDVGSGKTIVAFLALLLCVSNGLQGALMAPTEVLAAQHMHEMSEMTEKYDLAFRPILLTGSQTAKEKREIYAKIADGTYNVVIGTHAIIQDKVEFHNLALVITDEQHRFGVKQREALVSKGGNIHTIVMSATPIPRSLAIILYGDLDVTEMKELPSKRLPIKNCVVNQKYRSTAYGFMQKEISEGHQIYIICPMAQPGVMEELENVVDYATHLKAYFPETIQISYLHGKMKPKQKNEIMNEFSDGKIDILVSTTVIEVGINVPNATVMMVENAERFGLATLHQIRGRVGRGTAQSYCIFMETEEKKKKNERLEILNKSNDGFEIANEDLKLRGPGDFMGIEQSGEFHFRFADIYQDASMLHNASVDVQEILENDSLLIEESHIPLKKKLEAYVSSGYMNII